MAFFRPGNDDSNRWIFNLFHHFVGYSSLIISVGAISIALTQLYVVPGKSIKTKIHYIFRLDNRLVHWKSSQFYNMAWYCQIARYIQSWNHWKNAHYYINCKNYYFISYHNYGYCRANDTIKKANCLTALLRTEWVLKSRF